MMMMMMMIMMMIVSTYARELCSELSEEAVFLRVDGVVHPLQHVPRREVEEAA